MRPTGTCNDDDTTTTTTSTTTTTTTNNNNNDTIDIKHSDNIMHHTYRSQAPR